MVVTDGFMLTIFIFVLIPANMFLFGGETSKESTIETDGFRNVQAKLV